MIERLFLRDLISFEKVELEFAKGLVVMSGPSGAGKSLLIGSVLSCLGLSTSEAKHCEVELRRPDNLESQLYDLDDIVTIKVLKKDKARLYIDDQNISKKSLKNIFAPYVNYLSVRDAGGFESERLIQIFDNALISKSTAYEKLLRDYTARYATYKQMQLKLDKMLEDEKNLSQLIELTTFEVNKIKSINPKIGEDEELISTKKQLSKIDKINDLLERAQVIFDAEQAVGELYNMIDVDGSVFAEAMNQLRSDFEQTRELSSDLEEMDVESLLNRLEKITELKNIYGSIEEAISQKELKEQELQGYSNIVQDKSELVSFLNLEKVELGTLANHITLARIEESKEIAKIMDEYLKRLKLPSVNFRFDSVSLTNSGIDSINLQLNASDSSKLSGGEHNRLRLALLVSSLERVKNADGIIVLDEIDANVSGDESIAIAHMISKLSAHYQIFAISHQPHLSAKADQHILIDKQDGVSRAVELDESARIYEISRIIAGENHNEEAAAFAKKLLSENR